MTFFLISLLLCVILSTCLFVLLVYRLRINWGHKNRYAAGFVLPVLLMLAFIGLSVQLTVPRMLDTVSAATGRYQIEDLTFLQDQIGWNTLQSESGVMYFNRMQFEPQPGVEYRVSITPRSRFVIRFEPVVEQDAEVVSAN